MKPFAFTKPQDFHVFTKAPMDFCMDLPFRLLQEELTQCYVKMSGATVYYDTIYWLLKAQIVPISHALRLIF